MSHSTGAGAYLKTETELQNYRTPPFHPHFTITSVKLLCNDGGIRGNKLRISHVKKKSLEKFKDSRGDKNKDSRENFRL